MINENEEIISKEDLSGLLHSLKIPVNEGITSKENENYYPRILYWPYTEKDIVASGEGYKNMVTYQVSFFSRTPRHNKFKELRSMLRKKGMHPQFSHEYVEKDPIFSKTWHTYFSIDVLEEIEDFENE